MTDQKDKKDNSGNVVLWVVLGFMGFGALLMVRDWMVENPETVRKIQWGVWLVCLLIVVSCVLVLLRGGWLWWARRSGRIAGRGVSDGWDPGDRVVFAVMPAAVGGGGRRGSGLAPRRGKDGAVEFCSGVVRQAGGLGASGRVVRLMWVRHEGKWMWAVSVDRELGPSAQRSAGAVWPGSTVQEWPLHGGGGVSDGVPVEEGDGAVVRRYLAPEVLSRPLHTPLGVPDHPMARVGDVLERFPDVDVELRVDLVPLSAAERDRVCSQRLEGLDEWDPDRDLWEADQHRAGVLGVRVLLRVARAGVGHAAECTDVADRVCRVLDSLWSTDHNRLVARRVSDALFDRMWEQGVVEKDVPVFHWESLQALLGPPPRGIARMATGKRLPDPPELETFDPLSPGSLMPIGVVSEKGKDRLVGVPLGGDTEALVDWTVGATGSGKTWHALSRVVALADTGRGFMFLDPHRTAVADIKRLIGARHADRVLEIDLQAIDSRGEPMSAGWNPLDLTVVPPDMRKARIDSLKAMLPVGLFPDYFTADAKSPQTATIIRKALECLLLLNYRLPPQIQANIFCIENLLVDTEWRNLAIAQLKPRDQKWWHHTYPMIVGEKGSSSAALKPALNGLEQWKTQDRVQALLGASQSTLRWRDIIDGGKILLVVLNNDRSETDNLLARLIVGEMVTAFKERGLTHQGKAIRPFHLFLDEFQSYSQVIEAQAEVFVQELRKFGAKVHFLNQSPSALKKRIRDFIIANLTHLFCGRMGNPADADLIAKAMGGQTSARGGNDNDNDGPAPIHSRDLLKMAQWHFTCQVTQQGELSSAFQLKSINVDQTWAHLQTDKNITEQITANTGLVSVEQRLDHYDTLPERIAHWLQTGQPIITEKMIERQHQNNISQPNPPSINGSNPQKHARPQPTTPTTPADVFTAWANACVVEATPDTATPTAALTTSHSRWCQQNNTQPVPQRELQQLITNKWGPSETARIGGKVTRIRRGIKLRPPTNVTDM